MFSTALRAPQPTYFALNVPEDTRRGQVPLWRQSRPWPLIMCTVGVLALAVVMLRPMGATRTSLWVASGQAVGTTVHWRLAASGSWSRASQTELAAARVEATPQGVEAAPQAVAAAQVARLGSTEERGLLPSLWIRVAAVVMATTAVFAVTKARKVHANSARAWSMASGSADGVIAPPDEEDDPLTDLTITALVHTPDAVVIDTVTAHIDNSASVIEDEVEEEEEEVIEDVNIQDAPNNYYDLLEVDREASPVDIKSQYRKIQKICHPDIVGDQVCERAIERTPSARP